jgi:signal transduction histidine kinase
MHFADLRQPLPFDVDSVLKGVAQQVVGDIPHFSRKQLERCATEQERVRIAHELHDGVLQSLTALALKLQGVSQLLDTDFDAARALLREIQMQISAEQRELREWITHPPAPDATADTAADLALALQKLCHRAEWQWRFKCELVVDVRVSVPRTLGDHVYRIVQEGLNNAGRHAHAQHTRVVMMGRPERLDIELSDDGLGFPVHGQYDLSQLTARCMGPRSLKDRIALLHGTLVLITGSSGSRLQISLPHPARAWSAQPRQSASD